VVLILIVIAIVAFFALAGVYGADSRPYDARGRRWL
jgi:hypothetical protein